MTSLSDKSCEACRAGAPLATRQEREVYLSQLDGWKIIDADGVDHLQKVYPFKNFARALEFTNQVGELAETENHHPALLTEWGKVTVTWWTHKISGLHTNDFIMAAKTDDLL